MLSGNDTSLNDVQPLNKLLSISLYPSGITIFSSELHSLKAQNPIGEPLYFGKVICFKLLQSEKANVEIVAFSGKTTSSKFSHPSKALSPIVSL